MVVLGGWRRGLEPAADELYYFWRQVVWRVDREGWAVHYWLQRDLFPGWVVGVCHRVQEHCVGAVQKGLRRGFEVGGCRIEHGQVEIWLQEAQDAVRFYDRVLRGG